MGAGIAAMFKSEFGGVEELKKQNCQPGEVAILKRGGRYLYYLVTKIFADDIPTYEKVQTSLAAMREHALENHVSDISMPQIACGLDKLQWVVISEIIQHVFKGTNIGISVYVLPTSTSWT
jgi:hypothetical protein